MEAIILAGGFGTRLKNILPETPKILAPIDGKPMLWYLINNLQKQSINKIHISLFYKSEEIVNTFKNESGLHFHIEDEPLGTGGAILYNLNFIQSSEVLIFNGDVFTDINLNDFILFHKQNNYEFTISATKLKDASRFGALKIDSQNIITEFVEKSIHAKNVYINSGVYIANVNVLKNKLQALQKVAFSIEKDFFEGNNNLTAYRNKNYFIDIGTPEDYKKAQTEIPKCLTLQN